MNSAAEHKDPLRHQMRATLDALGPTSVSSLSARIAEHILEHQLVDSAIADGRLTAVFAPLRPTSTGRPPRSEVHLSGLAESLLATGAPVGMYRITGPREMHVARIAHWPHDLEYGPTGIPSVRAHCPAVPPADLAGAVLLIPGLAFDARGGRLGRGGGYFDTFLAPLRALSTPPTLLGVAFACQIVPAVPLDAWDIPMDVIITEDGPLA